MELSNLTNTPGSRKRAKRVGRGCGSGLGKTCGKKYGTLKKAHIVTSSRKFDEFGDWYLIKNRKLTKAIFTGKNRDAADKFYYDVR